MAGLGVVFGIVQEEDPPLKDSPSTDPSSLKKTTSLFHDPVQITVRNRCDPSEPATKRAAFGMAKKNGCSLQQPNGSHHQSPLGLRSAGPAGVSCGCCLYSVLCLDVIFPSARIFTTPPLPPSYFISYCENKLDTRY